jgi:hypothetical protein
VFVAEVLHLGCDTAFALEALGRIPQKLRSLLVHAVWKKPEQKDTATTTFVAAYHGLQLLNHQCRRTCGRFERSLKFFEACITDKQLLEDFFVTPGALAGGLELCGIQDVTPNVQLKSMLERDQMRLTSRLLLTDRGTRSRVRNFLNECNLSIYSGYDCAEEKALPLLVVHIRILLNCDTLIPAAMPFVKAFLLAIGELAQSLSWTLPTELADLCVDVDDLIWYRLRGIGGYDYVYKKCCQQLENLLETRHGLLNSEAIKILEPAFNLLKELSDAIPGLRS